MGAGSSSISVGDVATCLCNSGLLRTQQDLLQRSAPPSLRQILFPPNATKSHGLEIPGVLARQAVLNVRNNNNNNCEFFRVLNVTLVFDYAFCNDHGRNFDNSKALVEELARRASEVYERDICVTLNYNVVDGYCGDDPSGDPFASVVAKSDGQDRLATFVGTFDELYPQLKQTKGVAVLVTGCNTVMDDSVFGYAYERILCRQPRFGYATVVLSGTTAINCKQALTIMLHELGHSIGASHSGSARSNIMAVPFCNGCTDFREFEIDMLKEGLVARNNPENQCLQETTEDIIPTSSPSSSPILLPDPIPPPTPPPIIEKTTSSPTLSPTAVVPPTTIPDFTLQPSSLPTQPESQNLGLFIGIPGSAVGLIGLVVANSRFGLTRRIFRRR